jgi:glycerol kinase
MKSNERYILALDQGTTSSRAVLFDHCGGVTALAQEEFPQIYPAPGWVEHDPEDIWNSQLRVTRRVLAESGISARQVLAIGITNQRETTVLWDRKTGAPVHNAIVWQCRRTAPMCAELERAGLTASVREKTGLVLDPYFSGTKIRWLLDNVPGLRARATCSEICFGTIDTFLLWRLTGGRVHATDFSNASRTLLFNIRKGEWDDDLLAALDVPRVILPAVLPSSGLFGATDASLLGEAIPISGVAGDQQAALFGQACYRSGMAKNTYGTGCFLLMNVGNEMAGSEHGLLSTIAWRMADRTTYALEGSVFIAGAVIQWLRDALGIISTAAESEALASLAADSGGVYFVPAFVGLGAPHWDPNARGTILGITRGTTRSHLVRAALEAISYQTRDVLDAMQQDSRIRLAELRADGGASRNDLLMQIQANVLGVPVVRPRVTETTALGAAYLAGLAAGFWESVKELSALWQVSRRFEPATTTDQREAGYAGWRRALERARRWEQPQDGAVARSAAPSARPA